MQRAGLRQRKWRRPRRGAVPDIFGFSGSSCLPSDPTQAIGQGSHHSESYRNQPPLRPGVTGLTRKGRKGGVGQKEEMGSGRVFSDRPAQCRAGDPARGVQGRPCIQDVGDRASTGRARSRSHSLRQRCSSLRLGGPTNSFLSSGPDRLTSRGSFCFGRPAYPPSGDRIATPQSGAPLHARRGATLP